MPLKNSSALILDNFPLLQKAMQQMLIHHHGFDTVYLANDAASATNVMRENDIDLLVLDIQLGNFDGLDFLRRMKARRFSGKVLFVSSNEHSMFSDAARKMGANGYVLKTEQTEIIEDTISNVIRGYNVFKNQATHEYAPLSKRETVVYNYLAKGFTNKQISELLSISTKTVSTYKARILNKFNVGSIIELMQLKGGVIA